MSGNYRGKHVLQNGRNILLWAVGAAAVLALIMTVVFSIRAGGTPQGPGGQSSEPPMGTSSSEIDSAISSMGSSSGSAQPPPDVAVDPPEAVPYDFSQPVPQREAVENGYFDDAAFVGDSRTDGLMLYSGIGTGRNLTSNGLSIFKLAEKKALKIDGKKYTLLEALWGTINPISASGSIRPNCRPPRISTGWRTKLPDSSPGNAVLTESA